MKILGFGNCCVDYYIQQGIAYPGGNGLNVAVFAKDNGMDAAFIGTIGTDDIGKHIIKTAKKMGIDISHSPLKKGASGKAAVNIINGDRVWDEEYFGDEHGVGTLFPPMLSECDLEYVEGFDLIHGCSYAYLEDQFLRLVNTDSLLTYDFSDDDEYRTEEYLKEICPVLDLGLFSCEHIAEENILGFVTFVKSCGCKNVLITMGPRGQRFYSESGEVYEGKAKYITPIDTMGAGDSFCAAFLAGLLKRGWKKHVEPTGDMIIPALAEAAEYSAKNCLVEGSFGHGLKIDM